MENSNPSSKVSVSYAGERPAPLNADESKSNKDVQEVFNDPEVPETELAHRWTLWEQYDSKGKSYTETMSKVAWFGDLITFWQVWNQIAHADPNNFFSSLEEGKQTANFYEVNGTLQRVSSLAFFKTGVIPAWEDARNRLGGDYFVKIDKDGALVKDIWNSVILELVSGSFDNVDRVCGLRVVDKLDFLKIELWVDYVDVSGGEVGKTIESYFAQLLKNCRVEGCKLEFSQHKY